MGNESSTQARRRSHGSRRSSDTTSGELYTESREHIGNSAYKVKLFVDTSSSGYAGSIVSCCDVRLTKLASGVYDHAYITRHLEIITPALGMTSAHICGDCGDWKTYYKKCV